MKSKAKGFLLEFYRVFTQKRVSASASEMAYYLMFAFFPVVMVVYASLSLVGKANPLFVVRFARVLPESISQIIETFITHISSQASNISFLITGILLTLFSLTKFTRSAKEKIRKIYGTPKSKHIFREWLISGVFSVIMVAIFYVTLFVMISSEQLINILSHYIYISELAYSVLKILRYISTAFVIISLIFIFYLMIPNVKQTFSDVIFGTVFTVVGWIVVSTGFTFYINNFARYSVVYGSIGAFIILLLWFYVICLLLLVGAEINGIRYNNRAGYNAPERINNSNVTDNK